MQFSEETLRQYATQWPALPNILTANAFQNLAPGAKTCIVIEGMTRAGRYALASSMSEELNLKKFAFAEWLAKYQPADEPEKAAIETSLKNGTYLPDSLSVKIADWALEEFFRTEYSADDFYTRPFIMVGYPRTEAQILHFQSVLAKHSIYALLAIIEVNQKESQRRMVEKPIARIGHETDHVPEIQTVKIGEYYLKTHGLLKWLELLGKATVFRVCIDKKDYENRPGGELSVTDRGDYVVVSSSDLSKMIMMFLKMVHFVHYSGA
ncbi:hypothetical protein Ctha_1446 [Chloroherpeton thalassium ATCC 35110]|uniref:Adenylate kinase n=1 Tax=Chloroherpeton thalassium (strain ATCC 35110 / GB-78) TaxID=517418 RepID=B3QRV2_CHLT3|nr:hypothetical protein [Chloroherpeton thalassium]ACF13905.1 hypothetical protein Ctha_1446 [Chloroherpeton thalassium ATCC 35110]